MAACRVGGSWKYRCRSPGVHSCFTRAVAVRVSSSSGAKRGALKKRSVPSLPALAAGDQETAIGAEASVETLYLCASIVARSVPDPDAERS